MSAAASALRAVSSSSCSPSWCCRQAVRRIPSRSLVSGSKSWERSARLVKNTDVTNCYLDAIRVEHDPELHVKTLEEEIRGTMGKALGKQAEKIDYFMKLMDQERERHNQMINKQHTDVCRKKMRECAELHNQYRKEAIMARWELMVHRQAVGFLVNNHKIVHEKYQIGAALPVVDAEDGAETDAATKELPKASKPKFGTQTDWWQQVGRWR